MNPMAGLGGMQSAAYGGDYNQEEYDQMSAQLLFQLGQYPQVGMNSMNAMNPIPNMTGTGNMYEPMQMDWAANVGLMDQMPQMPPMPQIPQMGLQMDSSGNVKDEQKLLQSQMNPMGQQMSFDPNFGYFYQNQMNPLPNPTLVGNEAVNVDLSDYPTPQELEPEALSKDCKVDSAAISNPKPADDQPQPEDGGEREIEEKGESKPADSTNPVAGQQGLTD